MEKYRIRKVAKTQAQPNQYILERRKCFFFWVKVGSYMSRIGAERGIISRMRAK